MTAQHKQYLVRLAVVGFVVAVFLTLPSSDAPARAPARAMPKATEGARDKRLREWISPWDGSHVKAVDWIKARMHDPDSFQHIETKVYDEGDHLRVQTRFRGRNQFGAMVQNMMELRVGFDGEVLAQ